MNQMMSPGPYPPHLLSNGNNAMMMPTVGNMMNPMSPISSIHRNPSQSPFCASKNINSTVNFVHKLHGMVIDKMYQHLISWNYSGSSFVVCNVLEFSRDVLPKHFKHNNFSSFVRQLNMYGFHKVNKSPRGSRALAENQVWEFSHPKFLRDRPDLLDEIKRKTIESETLRRETGDIQAQMQMMQVQQSDMIQQLQHMQDAFSQVLRELADSRRKQVVHQQIMKSMMDYIKQSTPPTHVPPEIMTEFCDPKAQERPEERVPPGAHLYMHAINNPSIGAHNGTNSSSSNTLNDSMPNSQTNSQNPPHGLVLDANLTNRITSDPYLFGGHGTVSGAENPHLHPQVMLPYPQFGANYLPTATMGVLGSGVTNHGLIEDVLSDHLHENIDEIDSLNSPFDDNPQSRIDSEFGEFGACEPLPEFRI